MLSSRVRWERARVAHGEPYETQPLSPPPAPCCPSTSQPAAPGSASAWDAAPGPVGHRWHTRAIRRCAGQLRDWIRRLAEAGCSPCRIQPSTRTADRNWTSFARLRHWRGVFSSVSIQTRLYARRPDPLPGLRRVSKSRWRSKTLTSAAKAALPLRRLRHG